jgi:hypothetical protein
MVEACWQALGFTAGNSMRELNSSLASGQVVLLLHRDSGGYDMSTLSSLRAVQERSRGGRFKGHDACPCCREEGKAGRYRGILCHQAALVIAWPAHRDRKPCSFGLKAGQGVLRCT